MVLPAPFGPEQAEDGPGRDVEVEPVEGEDAAVRSAEALGQARGDADRRAAHPSSRPTRKYRIGPRSR